LRAYPNLEVYHEKNIHNRNNERDMIEGFFGNKMEKRTLLSRNEEDILLIRKQEMRIALS